MATAGGASNHPSDAPRRALAAGARRGYASLVRTLPPGHDVLLYDGACRLCRRAAARLARSLPAASATCSFREAGVLRRFPRLDVAACESAIQLVRKDGMVFAGAEAVVQALRGRWYGRVLRAYYLPGTRRVADAAYAAVARRRFGAGGAREPVETA